MTIKIATWNLCLGLTNKKDIVYEELKQKEIDICLLQEVEIKKDYDKELLSSRHYKIEVENNDIKARSAIIIKDNIEYKRRQDLEEINMGIVVIDLLGPNNYCIVNIYRSFNPANGITPLRFFESQLAIIKRAVTTAKNKSVVVSGDFNLNDSKRHALDYRNKIFFERLNQICDETNLIQLIEQPTWKRIVNNSVKTSILDHIYVKNPNDVTNIEMYEPLFGDHKLVRFNISARHTDHNVVMRRNWSHYSKEKLNHALSLEPFNIETDSV